jgi:multicomponent Na+:H+ antiporter subunit C
VHSYAGEGGSLIERLLLGLIFLIGFAAVVAHRNIIKKIFGLTILNTAAVILFVLGGSEAGGDSPILGDGVDLIVDPIPQALMLTAIVIGVCITALALALAFRLYRSTGSFNIDAIYQDLKKGDSGDHR